MKTPETEMNSVMEAVGGSLEVLRVPGLSEPISHYTDAVKCGGFLFISGQAALDCNGELVGDGDVVAQTRQTLANMQKVLEAAGSSFNDVVRVTVYLTNINDRQSVNPVREEFFGDHRPASTLVEVSSLAFPGIMVEIEAIARCGGQAP